jgi:hypothetical protein
MTKRQVRIESGANSDGLRIYVRDDESGVMLSGFTLDTSQLWDLLRGGHLKAEALMTDHFDRVGKAMEVDTVLYGSEDLRASSYDQLEADAEQLARADRPGWDEYEARRRGGGSTKIQVVMRRWV